MSLKKLLLRDTTYNKWVEDQTEDRIKYRRALDSSTVLNQRHLTLPGSGFRGLTHDRDFHLLEGDTIPVQMMWQTKKFGYVEGNGFQALELPYDGNELSMVIVAKPGCVDPKVSIPKFELSAPKFNLASQYALTFETGRG